MLGRSTGAVLLGVDARLVEVEVDLGNGLPTIAAVGLPGVAVREGIDRIRSALGQGGFKLPQRRITINLAPADVRKQGASLDLTIAVALLLADRQLPPFETSSAVVVGELGLDGSVRPVRGALSIALTAREAGKTLLLVPRANAEEAALVTSLEVVPVGNLGDVAAVCCGDYPPRPVADTTALLSRTAPPTSGGDLADVRGQAAARRALEIAAAGGHHLLLSGPPGSGKTMLARLLPGILPPLEVDEALEVTRIHSAAGLSRGLVTGRPFRAPHHGISYAGLTGGGSRLRPGEISLACHGVLYLDELPEFRRDALEALRQPLEDGTVTIVRVHAAATLPAAFTLVASMNPCPCGYHGLSGARCNCSPNEIRRYSGRLSGPLLDRFDLRVDVPPVELTALTDRRAGEASVAVRRRVIAARRRQQMRFGREGPTCNGRMTSRELNRFAALPREARRMVAAAGSRMEISARGYDRIRRLSRTLADLDGSEVIGREHVAEAMQYRLPAGKR